MKININACILAIGFAALAGCALEPRIVSDFNGLGTSEVARVIAKNFLNSQQKVEKDLMDLVNQPDILDSDEKPKKLTKLGFSCPALNQPSCIYTGQLNFRLLMPSGSVDPKNNVTKSYSIIVDYSKKPIAAKLVVETTKI
ncbi:hypothetical protein GTP91_14910 [Rugamonas sp. FT82W]|uniref:Lipoprotein n=1 Tax=Duganella vulcania TaxID=2692166 RepID=A0A845G6V5_9BURK|nr:hypothetical protein [Duganella vulcania]MYM88458.1 hypothetical protein [Duganella vulcania]